MEILYDPVKSFKNDILRQLPFGRVNDFEWDTAVSFEDRRFPYPELRIISTGFLGNRLYVVCFTPQGINRVRIISFRKANSREVKDYEKKIESYQREAANE